MFSFLKLLVELHFIKKVVIPKVLNIIIKQAPNFNKFKESSDMAYMGPNTCVIVTSGNSWRSRSHSANFEPPITYLATGLLPRTPWWCLYRNWITQASPFSDREIIENSREVICWLGFPGLLGERQVVPIHRHCMLLSLSMQNCCKTSPGERNLSTSDRLGGSGSGATQRKISSPRLS